MVHDELCVTAGVRRGRVTYRGEAVPGGARGPWIQPTHHGAMSLLEWLGEARNPGPSGGVSVGPPPPNGGSPRRIVMRAIIAVILLGVATWYAVAAALEPYGTLVAPIVLVVYLLASAFLHPEPDADNMGYLGGAIDNPFRISDDANRTMLMLAAVLVPGKFVVGALVDAWRLGRGRRTIVLRGGDEG